MKSKIAFLLVFIAFSQTLLTAGEQPEYLQSFNPTNGFRPAQKDLTEIFLQLAGSLEAYGSPMPWLRHVKDEDERIKAQYAQKLGKSFQSRCPSYMTDNYIDRVAKNWDTLSPKLGLNPIAKDIGNMMREGIKGTRGTGTIAVEIFNEHQSKVFVSMSHGDSPPASFDLLKTNLFARLKLDQKYINDLGTNIVERDAISYAICIHGVTTKLFNKLDANLKPDDANRIKTVLASIYLDVGRMTQAELEDGIAEWALDKEAATASTK